MMFEAAIFLAGAVLFFLAVLFFVFLWQDRASLARSREALEVEVATLVEQRVDLDIREHELTIWAEGLEHQQKAIEQAQEELRMLTASKQTVADPDTRPFVVDSTGTARGPDATTEKDDQDRSVLKNLKQNVKLST